jgi:hypothetical protein
MSEVFSETLKAFSDKHGAVLLGMHHELKEMQFSLDKSAYTLKEIQDMNAEIKSNIKIQKFEFTQYIKVLDAKNKKNQQMQDKCFALLREHKERDIELKNREVIVHKWMKRAEISVLTCIVLISGFIWYSPWTR